MGLRLRLHWFNKKIEQGIDYEYSSDFGDDRIIVDRLGLPVAHNIKNGYFDVEKHWIPMLQTLFYHWINLENYNYQVAFDYKDIWDIKNNIKKGDDMITEQFISIDKIVGIPLPYPLAEPPEGFFICQGQLFDKEKYPKLARCYPDGKLPDLRGEFIRGFDNGRGINPGRKPLDNENDALENHEHFINTKGALNGKEPSIEADQGILTNSDTYLIDAGQWRTTGVVGNAKTANETRPRNVVFNYIVLAA